MGPSHCIASYNSMRFILHLWLSCLYPGSVALACGTGEAWGWTGTTSCCTSGDVTGWDFTVNGGGNNRFDNIDWGIYVYGTSSVYTSSKCQVYNNGQSCVGGGCYSASNNHCDSAETMNSAERICLKATCNYGEYTPQGICQAQAVSFSFSSESYSWDEGSWGTCSKTCGSGTKTRTVTCRSSSGATASDYSCSGTKPSRTASCNTQSCASYSWDEGSWGTCSKTCGSGTKTRDVTCKSSSGATAYDSSCSGTKPSGSASCNTQSCADSQSTDSNYYDDSDPVSGCDDCEDPDQTCYLSRGQCLSFADMESMAMEDEYTYMADGYTLTEFMEECTAGGHTDCSDPDTDSAASTTGANPLVCLMMIMVFLVAQ